MISWRDILAGLARSTALSWNISSLSVPSMKMPSTLGSSSRAIARSPGFGPAYDPVLLSLYLPYERADARFARTLPTAADRVVHMINLTSADQVDDQLREWLSEAYDFNTD